MKGREGRGKGKGWGNLLQGVRGDRRPCLSLQKQSLPGKAFDHNKIQESQVLYKIAHTPHLQKILLKSVLSLR